MRGTVLVGSLYFCLGSLLFGADPAVAFDLDAHGTISRRSVQPGLPGASILNSFLQERFPEEFPDGIAQPINGRSVQQWLEFGSREEDSPVQRVQQHFHDPKKIWTQAGLSSGADSSVLWSQDPNQSQSVAGSNYSWKDARDAYFLALTSTSATQRQQYWAQTFETLGHLIHHVQDAATPAHTRNDFHPAINPPWDKYRYIGDPDRFHTWAEKPAGQTKIENSDSQQYDPSILNLPQNSLAPVPVARIIDTEKLRTTGIPSEGLDIGIAEYSNANFFSDDTIFDQNYQTPSDIGLIDEPGPDGFLWRYLYRHPGSPSTRYRLAVASKLSGFVQLPFSSLQWQMDDFVMDHYGEKLFPRAIGYSAGLIDYFFRNLMYGDAVDVGCGFPQIKRELPYDLDVEVASVRFDTQLLGEQTGTGRIVLVVHYRTGGQSHYFTWLDTTANLDTEEGAGWTLSGSALEQIPSNATDVYFTIAYRGPLGQEQDAVIGGKGFLLGAC